MSERYINVCTYCRSESIMQNDLGMMSCCVCKIKFKFPAVKKVSDVDKIADDINKLNLDETTSNETASNND